MVDLAVSVAEVNEEKKAYSRKLSLKSKWGRKKVKVRRKVQAKDVRYSNCGQYGGSGQTMRVTNTILGRMQTAVTCPTCQSGQSIEYRLVEVMQRNDQRRGNREH